VKLCLKPDICNLAIVVALRAYSLARLREPTEALSLARSLLQGQQQQPLDSSILDTLAHTFKTCNAEAEMCACYEQALNTHPSNIDYQLQSFMCYVRLHDHKKMQLLAQKMYKQTNTRQYLFWSVCAMLLQQNDLLPQMLVVAEKMLSKALFDGAGQVQPGAEELELYVWLLKRANKHEQALTDIEQLAVLRSPPAAIHDNNVFVSNSELVRLHSLRLSDMRIELLQSLLGPMQKALQAQTQSKAEADVPEVAVASPTSHTATISNCVTAATTTQAQADLIARKLLDTVRAQLVELPDQWTAHLQAVDLVITFPHLCTDMQQAPATLTEAVFAHRKYLSGQQSRHPALRGPYLAEIYLLQKLLEVLHSPQPVLAQSSSRSSTATQTQAMIGELFQLLHKYLDRFQTKQCVFGDVKPILSRLMCQYTCGKVSDFNCNGIADNCAELIRHLMVVCEQRSGQLITEIESVAGFVAADKTVNVESVASIDAGGVDELLDDLEEVAVEESNLQDKGAKSKSKKKSSKKKGGGGGGGGTKHNPSSASSAGGNNAKNSQAKGVFEHREKLVELLCALCKHEQIHVYCATLLQAHSASKAITMSASTALVSGELSREKLRMSLYRHTLGKLTSTNAGIGGDKEVQPGDELLMLCSAARRVEAQAGSAPTDYGGKLVWCSLLQLAHTMSPHNYQPRIDLIECYRRLGVGKAALEIYQVLGVRYVQVCHILPLSLLAYYVVGAARFHDISAHPGFTGDRTHA
jgi:hypothetical protein